LLRLFNFVFPDNGTDGTFRYTHGAVDALIRIDHQKVRSLKKAIHRANFYTIRVFALNTRLSYNKSHRSYFAIYREEGKARGIVTHACIRRRTANRVQKEVTRAPLRCQRYEQGSDRCNAAL
jgi:hypothetical protein